MNKLTSALIVGQIIGLIVVQGLELWRPGSVSTVVPIGIIWLTAVGSIGATTLLANRTIEASSVLRR